MEQHQKHRATLQRWLRVNAICQLILAITPLISITLVIMMGPRKTEDGKKNPILQPAWWLFDFVPFAGIPLLIAPFAIKTFGSPSLSPATARTLESWKSFLATAVYFIWFAAGLKLSRPRFLQFAIPGAILLCLFFYPALIYTWKVWSETVEEETVQRRLEEERVGTSGPEVRFPSEVGSSRQGAAHGPSETEPLLGRNSS